MNKNSGISMRFLWVLLLAGAVSCPADGVAPEVVEQWKDDRFGMFIHWGPISQMGQPLSHSRNSPSRVEGGKPYKTGPIEPAVYDAQYRTFNPTNFQPREVARLAKAAGMRYGVFTAKHHDGFSMFDSAYTDYDIMASPYGRDIAKMMADAFRDEGLAFGLYYSPRDWFHPDYEIRHDRYLAFFDGQIRELLENYGPLNCIWFDGLGPGAWGTSLDDVMTMIREKQPRAMVNNRGGRIGDFYTPEHGVGYFNRDVPWEACHTITGQWGFNPREGAKPLPLLMEILLYTWGADGNVLLNIGPRGDGAVNPVERERLDDLAAWWSVHGDSIRGSRGGPYLPGPWGVSTYKGNRMFLHVFRWPETGGLTFPRLPGLQVTEGRTLHGEAVGWTVSDTEIVVAIPVERRDPIVTTIALTLDRDIQFDQPLSRSPVLLASAQLTASHGEEGLEHLRDQNASTYWEGALRAEEDEFWIEARFDTPVTIESFTVGRGARWHHSHEVALQVTDANGNWTTVTRPKQRVRWAPVIVLDEVVTTGAVRLIISNTRRFAIAEFELYAPLQSGVEVVSRSM